MSGAFPTSMNLTTKPPAVPARSYRTNISPINGSVFQPSSTIKIDIPTGGSVFLDGKQSYLKFKIQNNGTAQLLLPGSALGMISRLEIYHGGQLLESIDQYNVITKAFLDAQSTPGWKGNAGICLWGTSSTASYGDSISSYVEESYCVPLMSGIIGSHLSKYTPLAVMDAAPLRLELTLTNQNGVSSTAVPIWQVLDVEYVAQLTELSADSMRMLRSALGGVVEISSESYRNYNYVIAQQQTSVSEMIPCKFSSVKGVYTTFRKILEIESDEEPITKRTFPCSDTSNFRSQYRLGSLNYPQKAIQGIREHFGELMKSFHAVSDITTGDISFANYSAEQFVLGQELESFAHSSDVLESGVNTLSQNTYIDLNLAGGAPSDIRMDVWAHFDQFLVVENGLASVRF